MTFEIPREEYGETIREVVLGATSAEGGTRGSTVRVGGARALPFHGMDGPTPNRPVVAMEVFDSPPHGYSVALKELYGGLLDKPADMARACVDDFGAEMVSVRLLGAHPDKGDRSPEECADIVKSVLEAVSVPVIVTGVNHFEKTNQVMKKVAEVCAGENLLLNWIETDNYKTVAAAALAYGHCVVALSPIDINMAKQLNILATAIGLGHDKIVMDPMISALGYGLDYGYTISERIRLGGLMGDKDVASPLLFNVGYECCRVKEVHVQAEQTPEWGDLEERAALWELVTASSLLLSGGDIFIMYHPKAVEVLKAKVSALFETGEE